jgi:Glycosyl transferase family 11
MIAVTLEGRLGNQLFQYAFIYAAARTLDTSFYLDKSIESFLLPQYFEVKNDFPVLLDNNIFSINGYKNIFSFHFKRAFYTILKKTFRLKELSFYNDQKPVGQLNKLKNQRIYTGYYQSEDYFKQYKNDIINLFTIKPRYKKQFEDLMLSLPVSKKLVVVHIRRGDYINHNFALDAQYFHKAIGRIHTDENYYVFVSDDIAFVRTEFDYIANKYISENTEIIDFQFLSHADICILSNSSFSWWGAYLNTKSPQVIAPVYWLGKDEEAPVNIIPLSWTKFN